MLHSKLRGKNTHYFLGVKIFIKIFYINSSGWHQNCALPFVEYFHEILKFTPKTKCRGKQLLQMAKNNGCSMLHELTTEIGHLFISAIKGVAYMLELTSVCHLSSKCWGHCVFNHSSSSLHIPTSKLNSRSTSQEHA